MRDDQRGALLGHRAQGGLDRRLHPGVHRGRRVVENQQPRVHQQRTGQRDSLPLPAGQGQPLLADHGVEPVRQGVDERLRVCGSGGLAHLGVGGFRPAVGDVGTYGVRQQEAVLEDDGEPGAQRGGREVADIRATEPHGAL